MRATKATKCTTCCGQRTVLMQYHLRSPCHMCCPRAFREQQHVYAAAPDLLAALNRLLDGFSSEAVAQANLAIAKAEGRA